MYQCSDCNYSHKRLFFTCPKCNSKSVDEIDETVVATAKPKAGLKSSASKVASTLKSPKSLKSIRSTPRKERFQTGLSELDRVLGGGFVDKEVVLFAASPGAGKSTLSMQICGAFAEAGKKVIYFSGEEREEQVADRAARLGIDSENISIVSTENLEEILSYISTYRPDFFVVDSIQMVASESITGSMGSISQSKEAANALTNAAKSLGASAVLISQVNKGEEFAGSMFIQHVVDCLLFFESSSDSPLKFLRVFKNRYGSTDEIGVFQHEEDGLHEVKDLTGIFLEGAENKLASGSSYTVIAEGRRNLIAEIQALTLPASRSIPRQQISGVEFNRAALVSAVLDKNLKQGLSTRDTFIATVNGVRVFDPQADLSIAASLLTSVSERALKKKTVFIGEIALSGFIKGNNSIPRRVNEASRLGLECAVIPKAGNYKSKIKDSSIKVIEVSSVRELHEVLKNLTK